jgi:cholesterol transport system auxiliary component
MKHGISPNPRRSFRFTAQFRAIVVGFLSAAILLAGCGKPPVMVHKYLLEYPAPDVPRHPQVPEGLKVELFAVAQAFNSPAMAYRSGSYKSEAYRYHRWRVNPGNLVTDFLLRDLRQAGLFKAVFGYDSTARPRFLLEGAVEEFQEKDEGEVWSAALGLNLTLLDTSKEEITQRVLFQKNYRTAEPLADKTPQGLADAMSRAVQKLSQAIILDVYQAARQRQAVQGGK